MRLTVLLLLVAAACGRTGQLEPGANESPLFVFVGDNCPTQGAEKDLTPEKFDGLVVVRMTAQEECSGAGGAWLIGRALDERRDFFVGEHACWFRPASLEQPPAEYFAVVRYSQTAALFHGPMGWCITDADGKEPVTTDSKNIAWGVYRTEAGARGAYARLKATP